MIVDGRSERRWEDHPSIARAFPFHISRYGRPTHRRDGASAGFYGLAREAIATTSFGRAWFVKRSLAWKRAVVAPGSAAELKQP